MTPQALFPTNSFKGALHLEMFNLQNGSSPTLLATSIRQYSRSFEQQQTHVFWTQRKVPSGIRSALARECGNRHFDIAHPASLPVHLRSGHWQQLIDALQDPQALDRWQQALLVRLLTSLGMHGCAIASLEAPTDLHPGSSEADYQYANALARARFLSHKETGAGYRDRYRPEDYWHIVNQRRFGSPAACSATFSLMLQYITEEPDISQAQALAHLLREQAQSIDDDFGRCFVLSVFHRGYALLPARDARLDEMIRHMDLADEYSSKVLDSGDPYLSLVAQENRYSVLESRIKEKFMIEDFGAAGRFAEQLLQLDPLDARALMSVGEAFAAVGDYERAAGSYSRAAHCGPLYTAAAWFMAGQCHAAIGQKEHSALCLLESLRIDPKAISAAEALAMLDPSCPTSAWAASRKLALEAESQ